MCSELVTIETAIKTIKNQLDDSVLSIIQYDLQDHPIQLLTGTFTSIFDKIKNFDKFYYRIASLNQNTTFQRISGMHFNVKISCIGGLEFNLTETLNRYLNWMIKEYTRDPGFSNFLYVLYHFQWYTTLLEKLELNTELELNNEINSILNLFPKFKSITDLNLYNKISGIYILVLDKYHVCYIGQAQNIRHRIMRHWSRSDYFSGTGIDLFKGYDTTRIYILECPKEDIDILEFQIINIFQQKYTLNKLSGGNLDFIFQNNLPLFNH